MPPARGTQPRIPEQFLDVPSQRLYYLSFGLLCQVCSCQWRDPDSLIPTVQAIKLFDFLAYHLTSSPSTSYYARKWLLFDFTYCFVLSQLHIPRLNYTKAVVILQIISLWFVDGLLFGGIRVGLFGGEGEGRVSTSGFLSTLFAVFYYLHDAKIHSQHTMTSHPHPRNTPSPPSSTH
jgi:nucleoporin POM152